VVIGSITNAVTPPRPDDSWALITTRGIAAILVSALIAICALFVITNMLVRAATADHSYTLPDQGNASATQ
jgi:hypothetical protein